MANRYEDLVVWQKAMSLAVRVYAIAKKFPSDERFGLTSQICRAAVSVPSNIAEGQGRATSREFRQFLAQARGSLFEVETQMRLAQQLSYIETEERDEFFASSAEIARLLNGLISSLGRSTGNRKPETGN